jgi:poly(A) polymerase
MLPDGRVTFHRHAEVGARMFDSVSRRLGFDREQRQRIRFLILHHMRANAYDPNWTDAAVRRFDHEMGGCLEELIELSRADVTSKRPGRRDEASRNIEALLSRILAIRELDARVPPLPPAWATRSWRRSRSRRRGGWVNCARSARTPSSGASSSSGRRRSTT